MNATHCINSAIYFGYEIIQHSTHHVHAKVSDIRRLAVGELESADFAKSDAIADLVSNVQ